MMPCIGGAKVFDLTVYIITGVIALAAIALYIRRKMKRAVENLKQRLRSQWGRTPETQYKTEEMKAIAGYYENVRDNCGNTIGNGCGNGDNSNKRNSNNGAFFVDDITWNDLDMDDVYKRTNNTQTSVGEEYLYYLLRSPVFDGKALEERGRLVEYFSKNPVEREKLQMILAGLGKRRYAGIHDFFMNKTEALPRSGHYALLSAALLLSPLTLLINTSLGFVLIVAISLTNILTYYKAKNDRETYLDRLSYIVELIRCASKISKGGIGQINAYSEKLGKLSVHFRSLAINSFYQLFYTTNDVIFEPLKSTFLIELIAFQKLAELLDNHKDEIRELYETVGFLDCIVSIASYRESLEFHTVPSLYESSGTRPASLHFTDAFHPLIENPTVNSIDIVKPVLITGSNASGKSTFLKMAAINAIFAQTIYTCLAREYDSSYFMIFSSMALKDDVANGRSYYVTEINSLKRIIDNMNGPYPLLCMVDEVLRGTNTVERIAASSMILDDLSERNCIIVAATHDIELATILKDQYDNYHFHERFEGNSIFFEYKIHPGKSTTRNAIKLLRIMGYPDQIVNSAEDMAGSFLREGVWNYYPGSKTSKNT